MNNKFLKYFAAIASIIFLGYYLILDARFKTKLRLNDENIYQYGLNGRICHIEFHREMTIIKLCSKETEYYLEQARNYDYNDYKLSKFLRIGDSIYVPPYKDTIYIYRENNEYYFVLGNVHLNYNNSSY